MILVDFGQVDNDDLNYGDCAYSDYGECDI